MGKDYGSWTLTALKAELVKRNAKRTGKKAVLVQRLHDYDKLFGDLINNPENCYKILTPPAKDFMDINSDCSIPILCEQSINTFCFLAEHEDKERAYHMYDENYLMTCRYALEGTQCYVSAICASEMRKQISYNTLIKYENSTVIEAQCECAAGMGPYAQCKHVLVVLYAIIEFSKHKKIRLRVSKTSTLQSFHHPAQIYTGNPIQAENFKIRKKDDNLKRITSFDPRPSGSAGTYENYKVFFFNHCIGFGANQNLTMPIMQITKPANKKAFCMDHDYLEERQEDIFLKKLLLSPDQICTLEKNTRTNKKEWQKQRLFRLHSSNFGKICKCKDANKQKLAKSFLKNIEVMTTAIKHGLKYEQKALSKFSEITGHVVSKCGIVVHSEHQFLASTPDGLVGENCTVEVKCPYSAANFSISSENIPYILLNERSGHWELKKNHDYYYQVQGQLLCTNKDMGYFCIYTHNDFCILEIQRDEQFTKNMLQTLCEFYNKYYKELFVNRYFYNIKF